MSYKGTTCDKNTNLYQLGIYNTVNLFLYCYIIYIMYREDGVNIAEMVKPVKILYFAVHLVIAVNYVSVIRTVLLVNTATPMNCTLMLFQILILVHGHLNVVI